MSVIGAGNLAPVDTFFARGHYFSYTGRSPFNRLIYPIPVDGGLGIHATNDMGGAARFGPDVRWINEIDYSFSEGLQSEFVQAIKRYFPDVDPGKLSPSYTGIRPKLSGPGQPAADFCISGPETHGVRGLVNLFGMESPALTASLAVADYVHALLLGD
jgi:L-2-hydroxyglutarate oxidase LhgO